MKPKYLLYLPALVFAIFAALQYNKPNPIFWILIYLFAAICTVLQAHRKLNYLLVLLGFLGYFFLLTYNFPPIDKFSIKFIEGQNAIGLIICGNWIAILGIYKLYKESYR